MTMSAYLDDDDDGPPALTLLTNPTLWRPRSQADLAPAGAKSKARANIQALWTLRSLQESGNPASPDDAAHLARWAGWGALPEIFDEAKGDWDTQRSALRALMSDREWEAARRTVLNAHYTSAEVVTAMWRAVLDLGFAGGKVLEPGCGSGNFMGLAPGVESGLDLRFLGVELDPLTAAIAAALYPDADIRAEGFETTNLAPDSFDLVVGNVPFAKLALNDPLHNRARHSIHNHFIIKALRFLRPGGLAAVLTSRYTLDSRNPAARREMAELADLVGAVRLPEGAFRSSSGTEAVIDLLILRRRQEAPSLFTTAWSSLVSVPVAGGTTPTATVNEYFAAQPGHVLGTLTTDQGMYGKDEVTVQPVGDLAPALAAALADITTRGIEAGLAWAAPPRPAARAMTSRRPAERAHRAPEIVVPVPAPRPQRIVIPAPPRKEGTILAADGKTGFGLVRYGAIESYSATPKSDTAELRALVQLRDIVAALIEAQATSGDDEAFAGYQAALNDVYDAYVASHGPLNRFSLRTTGRMGHKCGACGNEWTARSAEDAPAVCPACAADYGEVGSPRLARIRPKMGGFRRHDPDFPVLMALESFDPETQTASKAPIFTTRVVAPRSHRTEADSPRDALSICLDTWGDVRLGVIAGLLDVDEAEARSQLGELVWDDPATGTLLTATAYLSGNVRIKLDQARHAALQDERFTPHVEALTAVLPEDLGPTEIDARLGCTWIEPKHIKAFLVEVLGAPADRTTVGHIPLTATWTIGLSDYLRSTVAMTSEWGTRRADAVNLVTHSLNQSPATVYDTVWDDEGRKKQIINPAETLAARDKQELLGIRFSEWVWTCPERAEALVRVYNDRFNSTVTPAYDGSHLTLPGLSNHITPHPHQLDSIWRMISEPTVGLFQPVGSGKTLIFASGAMEMRRLGLVNKPVIVVPNHMLHQVTAEIIQHYPRARILMATKEQTDKKNRKEFVARCAMGDWDAIVITHSSFTRIPVSDETRATFLDEKIEALRDAIELTKKDEGSRGVSVKRMELAVAKLEERHERLMNARGKDDGLTFEAAGFDYIVFDEAHFAKRMAFPTRIQGAGVGDGSQIAEDLEVKIGYLRSKHGARVATLSTATPVANTLAEVFVNQRYLDPEGLRAAKVFEFDAWAANFGRVINELELSPDGSTYRIGSRFARFRNVPDLMRMFWVFADVKTPDQLNLPTPAIAGGVAEVVAVPSTDGLAAYMALLAKRAEAIRGRACTPKEDNMLKLGVDGRKAGLALRLVTRPDDTFEVPEYLGLDPAEERELLPPWLLPENGPTKVQALVGRVAAIWEEFRHTRFRDSAGNIAARPGGAQIVFADLGTPKEGRWSVYEDLRGQLHEAGLPVGSVRFLHEAKSDQDKAAMFEAARNGQISVLVTSTAKGGVGTNIQARLVALHHLDCPWRPCDIEQREGRILRQGNQNATVRIIRYVTKSSFDIYLWQTVARKAAFIYQVMSGKFKGREVDDLGEASLSYAEVKALATGNPLIMEAAGVDAEVARLTRSARAHAADQQRLKSVVRNGAQSMANLDQEVAQTTAAIERRVDSRGDRFAMEVMGESYDVRKEAGEALVQTLIDGRRKGTAEGHREAVAHLAGQIVTVTWTHTRSGWDYYAWSDRVELRVKATGILIKYNLDELDLAEAHSVIIKLENRIFDLEHTLRMALVAKDKLRIEIDGATSRLGMAFPHEADLVTLTARAKEITAALAKMAADAEAKRNENLTTTDPDEEAA